MKIKTFNRMLLALSCAAAISVGCDKSSETEQKAPSITISGISAGAESVTFTVSAENADNAAYLLIPASGNTPDANSILSTGTKVNPAATGSYTAEGLTPDTDYIIYVAAKNKTRTALEFAQIQTDSKYDGSFVAKEVLAMYYGNRDTRNKERYNFYLVLSDVGFDSSMYPNPNGDYFFRIDFYYEKAEDPDNAVIPDGTYGFDGLNDEPESGLLGNRSGFFRTDDMSFHKDKHDFENATFTVTTTEKGKRYHLKALLNDGKMYEITYEGDIKFDNQSGESTGGKKDQLPPLESDINAIFTIGEGSIIAQQDDLSQVSLAFSDMAIEDGQLTPPGNLLNINIITVLQDGKIPERTFSIQADESEKNFIIPGQEEYEAGTYYPVFSYVQNYVTSNSSTTGYVNGGSVTIKKSAKGYSFDIDLTTKDGHKVTGKYDGEFPLYGPGNSTLTEDYEIQFPSDTKATAVYYGDYYSTSTGNWMLVLMPESEKGDAFYIECFRKDLDFSKGFAYGTYTPETTGKDMTFLPGEINDNGQLAYTYYAYVDGNNIYNYAPITGGSVSVSQEGETTAIIIEGIDDSGHKVSGKWSGSLNSIDNSSATTTQAGRRPTATDVKCNKLFFNK